MIINNAFLTGLECEIDHSKVSEAFRYCAICHCYPREPLRIVVCGHVICAFCNIAYHTSTNRRLTSCPLCRATFNYRRPAEFMPLALWSAYEKAEHLSVEIKCPAPGCTFVGDKRRYLQHEQYECAFRKVKCPYGGCNEVGTFAAIQTHAAHCDEYRIECKFCQLMVRELDQSAHSCRAHLFNANQSKFYFLYKILLHKYKLLIF